VAVVLSGYTATLNPSDRATLHFLQLCEEIGVDLTEFKPIVFGKVAVKQYTAKVRGRVFLLRIRIGSVFTELPDPDQNYNFEYDSGSRNK